MVSHPKNPDPLAHPLILPTAWVSWQSINSIFFCVSPNLEVSTFWSCSLGILFYCIMTKHYNIEAKYYKQVFLGWPSQGASRWNIFSAQFPRLPQFQNQVNGFTCNGASICGTVLWLQHRPFLPHVGSTMTRRGVDSTSARCPLPNCPLGGNKLHKIQWNIPMHKCAWFSSGRGSGGRGEGGCDWVAHREVLEGGVPGLTLGLVRGAFLLVLPPLQQLLQWLLWPLPHCCFFLQCFLAC